MDMKSLAEMLAADMDPQALQRMLQLQTHPGRSELVQQQLAQAQQMRQPGPQRKGVFGTALGGIANALGSGMGAQREAQAMGQLRQMNQEQAQALQGMGPAMQSYGKRLMSRQEQEEARTQQAHDLSMKTGQASLDAATQAQQDAAQPVSAPVREWLKQNNVNLPEGITNGEARKYMGGIFDLVKEKMEQTGQTTRLDKQLGAQGDIEAQRAEAAKREAAVKGTGDLRKELQGRPEFKAFNEVSVAYEKVKSASSSTDPAANMALIFSYMKMLDPGSSVREGEYATAQNTTGIPGQILNMYNRARNGNFLNQQQVSDFVNAAGRAYAPHKAQFDALASQYSGLAQKQGADPTDVVLGSGGLSPEESKRLQELEKKFGGTP